MKKPNHERIYLIPGSYDGENCYVWSDDPAPGNQDDPADAVEYVRGDLFNALAAQIEQLREAVQAFSFSFCYDEEAKDLPDPTLCRFAELQDSLVKTPAQCLAELRADIEQQVILSFIDWVIDNDMNNALDAAAHTFIKIRQQAKVGE